MASEQRRCLLELFGNSFSELRGVPVAMDIPPVQNDGFQKFVLGGGKERDRTLNITWVAATIHKISFHDQLSPVKMNKAKKVVFVISGLVLWSRWQRPGNHGTCPWPVPETGC